MHSVIYKVIEKKKRIFWFIVDYWLPL